MSDDVADTPAPVEFTTPIEKHKLLLKPYATGFDQEAIDKAMFDSPFVDTNDPDYLPPTNRANRKSFEIMVISVDGKTENVADLVLAMNRNDTQSVIEKINEIVSPISEKKNLNLKKPSDNSPEPAA